MGNIKNNCQTSFSHTKNYITHSMKFFVYQNTGPALAGPVSQLHSIAIIFGRPQHNITQPKFAHDINFCANASALSQVLCRNVKFFYHISHFKCLLSKNISLTPANIHYKKLFVKYFCKIYLTVRTRIHHTHPPNILRPLSPLVSA